MARFSERIGAKPPKTLLQVDSMDDDLKNGLWNACHVSALSKLAGCTSYTGYDPFSASLLETIWANFFKIPIDIIPLDGREAYKRVRDSFFHVLWPEVYDFVEFLAQLNLPNLDQFIRRCNTVLETELSGYRFVGRQLARITHEEELAAVQKTLEMADTVKPVRLHIQAAVSLFSDRKTPDYRNSIKESISAVEAMCRIVIGDDATLGQALKKLEDKGIPLHPALKNSFSSLYGYTNDAQGIRHAQGLLEEPNLDFDDAKFMLVSCSAFVNYLAAKASKSGVIAATGK